MLKIDTHAHWFPPEWVELVAREGGKNGAEVAIDAKGEITKFQAPGINRGGFAKQYIEIPIRLKIMDDGRVDMHALSLTSPMVYWATPDFGLKLSQAFNDACSAVHLKYPKRFVGMATVPMQAPALAVQEHGEEPTGIRAAHHSSMLRERDKREAVALAFADEALRLRLLEEGEKSRGVLQIVGDDVT